MSNLHETTHWRRLRSILSDLFAMEAIPKQRYNFEKIVCYKTVGSEMQGNNTKFHGVRGRSFLLGIK